MGIKTKFGTAVISDYGYLQIASNKEKNKGKYVHRLIFEDFYNINLNEEFPEGIIIHHIDGNKTNNAIWNLEPMSIGDHTTYHNSGENNTWFGKHHSMRTKKKISFSQNSTGIFRVDKHKSTRHLQGYDWRYRYYDENGKRRWITSKSIDTLKQKVLDKGLDWIVIDEQRANECGAIIL